MIFRWCIYGEAVKNIELLKCSISSFRKHFGNSHQYIVYTDSDISVDVEVRKITNDSPLYVISEAPWMKWYPRFRLDINQTEFFIDYDVFLVKYPTEIDLFLSSEKHFAILDEFKGRKWQHGAMHRSGSPYINSGFFIQKAGYDITPDFMQEFEQWKDVKEPTHHDEQGSLANALSKHLDELYILPKDKYMLIGKTENANLESLDGVILFHAVYPDHPAFYKFYGNKYITTTRRKNINGLS